MVSHSYRCKTFDNGFFTYWWIAPWLKLFSYICFGILGDYFNFIFDIHLHMKGSLIWNIQRYSALIMLMYFIYVISFIINAEGQINFFTWSNFFLSFETRFFTSLTCILILIHAYIGLWTVGTDYLTERTLGFLNKPLSKFAVLIQRIYLFAFIVLGIVYLIVILYIIWI